MEKAVHCVPDWLIIEQEKKNMQKLHLTTSNTERAYGIRLR